MRADGGKNMIIGALWCVGGILVTAITYNMAANDSHGGSYFVAYGAVIFGGIQFFKGLLQFLTGK
jgi:hypothetical protein